MKRYVAGLALVLATSGAWALPSVDEVEAQVKQGNYTQAETMMSEVVAAKPGSARAHYFYAELLAHNGSFARASQEAAKAREIDPKISFTEPEKFRSFESTLQREQAKPRGSTTATGSTGGGIGASMVPAAAAVGSGGGIPGWVWLVGLVVLAIVLWKGFSRSRAAAAPAGNMAMAGGPQGAYPYGANAVNPAAPYGPGAAGYGPGAMQGGPMQQGARPGGGLLGTGLAVAGGVAGGMLIDQMLHRGGTEGAGGGAGIGNLGGVEPGNSGNGFFGGDAAAQELESRPIDFGNGGNDWDSGGGSVDSGGGDSGGGWD